MALDRRTFAGGIGFAAGAAFGATIGGALGAAFFGIGAIPGAALGALIGFLVIGGLGASIGSLSGHSLDKKEVTEIKQKKELETLEEEVNEKIAKTELIAERLYREDNKFIEKLDEEKITSDLHFTKTETKLYTAVMKRYVANEEAGSEREIKAFDKEIAGLKKQRIQELVNPPKVMQSGRVEPVIPEVQPRESPTTKFINYFSKTTSYLKKIFKQKEPIPRDNLPEENQVIELLNAIRKRQEQIFESQSKHRHEASDFFRQQKTNISLLQSNLSELESLLAAGKIDATLHKQALAKLQETQQHVSKWQKIAEKAEGQDNGEEKQFFPHM